MSQHASNGFPKVFLIVLDGFGTGKDDPCNAIQHAHMPFYRELTAKFPHAQILTSGEAVGLPRGVMGNSEVGHTNMGAGRIVYQELTRITKAIHDGDFDRNPEFLNAIEAVQRSRGRLHLMGLLSDAGVHSHLDHLKALIKLAAPKVPVTIHAFMDGRDTPPTSGKAFIEQLGDFISSYGNVVLGTMDGRYYAMDRDNRWDRVEQAWKAITGQTPAYPQKDTNGIEAALAAIDESYARKVTDEFIIPTLFEPQNGRGHVVDGDGVIFFNFRSDRARELTRAFKQEGFDGFKIRQRPKLAAYVCMTQYDKTFGLPIAFPPQNLSRILPDLLAEKHLKQFRIAETEKYAHVTFFFNGGRETPYSDEDRTLIPSPKDVPTYDLKPEMSAFQVAEQAAQKLERGDAHFVLLNFANADMVGHTGKYDAAVRALDTVDQCLKRTISVALKSGYDIIITADHGNAEQMCDEHGEPHTQHTTNPVPVHYISNKFHYKLKDGILADLAPTILQIMNIPQPPEMTGHSLLKGSRT